MRRYTPPCFALALLAALAMPAEGQGVVRVLVGPFAGMNYTSFSGDDADGTDARWDFALGGQLDVLFGGTGLFRSGLIYSGRGAQTTENGATLKVKLHYLEVPLLLGYRFPTTGVRPYVEGGAQVGFKTGCKLEGSEGGTTVSLDCEDPDLGAGEFASTDFSLVGGGGIAVPFGRGDLTFDLRYAFGLTKIEDSSDIKNRGFTFGVGLMFPIGR